MHVKSLSAHMMYLFCCLLLLASTTAHAQKKKKHVFVGEKKIKIKDLDKGIEELIQGSSVPAMSLALINNNEVVYHNTYGITQYPDGKEVNNETVFCGGSLSKTYLLFAAYWLADRDILDLDKPVYQYLENPRLDHDERYKLITTRMILNHSSGIENWQFENDPKKLEIMIDPGSGFVYSGEGFVYLSQVVEEILGETYEEYITRIVAEPLGLNLSRFALREGEVEPDNYATNHNAFKDNRPSKLAEIPKPAHGIYFTAEEYAKLIIACFDTTKLSPESIKNFTYLPDTLGPDISKSGVDMYRASGFYVLKTKENTAIHVIGAGDGNFSVLAYSPSRKVGVIFMTNSGAGYFVGKRVAELAMDFDIDWTFRFDLEWQYPSIPVRLIGKYDKESADPLLAEMDEIYGKGDVPYKEFVPPGEFFYGTNRAIADDYLQKLIQLYPNESWSYKMLGKRYIRAANYNEAITLLEKAQANGAEDDDFAGMIEECKVQLAKSPD